MSLCKQYQELFNVYHCTCGGLHVGRVSFKRIAPAPPSKMTEIEEALDRVAHDRKEDSDA